MDDESRRSELRSMRMLATALLLAMGVLFLIARSLQAEHPWLEYVAAFAEAGMVGAVADWFAVTALFRRPLGLPFPHTAVVQQNKDRIGEKLGDFVEQHFLPREVISARLAKIDFADLFASWLATPGHSALVAERMALLLPPLLRTVDDAAIRQFICEQLSRQLNRVEVGPLTRNLVNHLVDGDWHSQLLDLALREVITLLIEKRPLLLEKLHSNTGWLSRKLKLDERALTSAVRALEDLADELENDPDHEIRQHFDRAVKSFINSLADDFGPRADQIKQSIIGSSGVQDHLSNLWNDIRDRLLTDLQSPQSATRSRLQSAFMQLGDAVAGDAAMRNELNRFFRQAATELIESRRGDISRLIPETVRTWDAATMAERLELQIGKDLQFIRINGTLVGGLAGLTIHAVSRLLF